MAVRRVGCIRVSLMCVLLMYGASSRKQVSMKSSGARYRRGQLIMLTKSMCAPNCGRSTSRISCRYASGLSGTIHGMGSMQ